MSDQKPNYAIDPRRSTLKDKDDPDAVWVAVVSPRRDDVESVDAKADAVRWATKRYGGTGNGCDRVFGPHPDDGNVRPPLGGDQQEGPISVDQYLHMAASQKLGVASGKASNYVCFYRVRRPDAI